MAEYLEREKLLKAMEEMCKRVCDYSPAQRHFMCGSCPLGSAFELVEEFPAVDVQPVKWISVYDQLPDYNMVVLVTDGEDVGTGYRYALGETGFMGWAVPFADIEEDDVSYWMPLPEPPMPQDGET